MNPTGKIKCVEKIHTEYITVGQVYNYAIDKLIACYRRTDNSSGSYMTIEAFRKHIASGAIVLITK